MKMKRIKIISLLLAPAFLLTGCSTANQTNSDPISKRSNETVIIIHGLARSGTSMNYLTHQIAGEGFQTCVIDYASLKRPIDDVVADVSSQINRCSQNAENIHFVGHSLGGLLTRAYLANPDNTLAKNKLGHVVMIGTPNHGSAIVDHYQNQWWMKHLGGTTLSLGTGNEAFVKTLPPVDFNHGLIAGTWSLSISDRILGETNDGLVSVSSVKTASMNDFVAVNVGHSRMRRNKEVADQTVHFLKHGIFEH